MIEVLGIVEAARLTACEKTIEQGLASFVEVGEALLTIRESRLYRANHHTFEDYCRERWGWGRDRSEQLIRAAEVVHALPTNVGIRNEAQARELAPLRDEPARMAEVWERVVEETDGRPTALAVRERVRSHLGRERTDVVGQMAQVLQAADRAAKAADEIQRRHLSNKAEEIESWLEGLRSSLESLNRLLNLLTELA